MGLGCSEIVLCSHCSVRCQPEEESKELVAWLKRLSELLDMFQMSTLPWERRGPEILILTQHLKKVRLAKSDEENDSDEGESDT